MLQIASQSLQSDNIDSEVELFLERNLPNESFRPWLNRTWPGGGLAMLTQQPGLTWGTKFKINRLFWPMTTASRWGYGHYLCGSDTAQKISNAVFSGNGAYTLTQFKLGNPETNPAGTINFQGKGETISLQMYVLPPKPLSAIRGLKGQIQSLYLITLVDPRYFWWWSNLSQGGMPVVIGNDTTWDSLLGTIKSILNINITGDSVNSSYLQPSIQAYTLPFEPLPLIIDSIMANIGMRFVAGLDGTYAMQLYNTALTALNNDMTNNPQRMIIAGGQLFASPM
jgi:hypothetical protein